MNSLRIVVVVIHPLSRFKINIKVKNKNHQQNNIIGNSKISETLEQHPQCKTFATRLSTAKKILFIH